MNEYGNLLDYAEVDFEKRDLIRNAFSRPSMKMISSDMADLYEEDILIECNLDTYSPAESVKDNIYYSKKITRKICPKCQKTFAGDVICPHCDIKLISPEEFKSIKYIKVNPVFNFKRSNEFKGFDELLTDANYDAVAHTDFTIADFRKILANIKRVAFRRLNRTIRDNKIDLDNEKISYIVLLFTKAFVNVENKSSGAELGYYEFNKIFIDDRQTQSLQITTMLHELTHFLIKEMLTHVLCHILDCSKNGYVEAFITYILSYSGLNRLIDEYAAHTVEARFTIFGYQDYSSFIQIQNEVAQENVEIAKIIGNTFANYVKDIAESFIDDGLRGQIKDQFISDTHYSPDFRQLEYETCKNLTDDGLIQAIVMILSEGFLNADLELLGNYVAEFNADMK